MKHFYIFIKQNPVWIKVIFFSTTLFLIRLSDGIVSFWAPNQIQNSLGNSFLMGLIISFQSVVGLLCDLFFPHLLRSVKTRRLMYLAIVTAGLMSFFLFGASIKPFVFLFLTSMALWGMYYEFLTFAEFRFVGVVVPAHLRTGAWGVMGVFKSFAYFLGPLLAAFLLDRGIFPTEIVVIIFLLVAFVFIASSKKVHEPQFELDTKNINPMAEVGHWVVLFKHVWPVVIMSIILGFIDSTFWTIGAVLTETLGKSNSLGNFFLPIYMLPSLFVGILVAKWGIYEGKKRLAEIFMLVSGVILVGFLISSNLYWQLLVVFLASLAISIAYPLIEGVYSDIMARMGRQKDHLIGLTSSTVNISYIIWPPIAGYIAGKSGEINSFVVVGALTAVVSLVLLFVTPKKLTLPQSEIQSWKD